MDFSEFLNHEEESVRRTAAVLQELTETLEMGVLKKEEYDELVGDLLDMEKIDGFADTVERKANIEKAFKALTFIITKIV